MAPKNVRESANIFSDLDIKMREIGRFFHFRNSWARDNDQYFTAATERMKNYNLDRKNIFTLLFCDISNQEIQKRVYRSALDRVARFVINSQHIMKRVVSGSQSLLEFLT
jgi:hypothetical protein